MQSLTFCCYHGCGVTLYIYLWLEATNIIDECVRVTQRVPVCWNWGWRGGGRVVSVKESVLISFLVVCRLANSFLMSLASLMLLECVFPI